jgi:hypothetical protein
MDAAPSLARTGGAREPLGIGVRPAAVPGEPWRSVGLFESSLVIAHCYISPLGARRKRDDAGRRGPPVKKNAATGDRAAKLVVWVFFVRSIACVYVRR